MFRALMAYPTHKNCREQCEEYQARGFWAECYPARLFDSSKADLPPNCWEPKADVAEAMGFPVVRTVCPRCPFLSSCEQHGYLSQLKEASAADVAFVTHKRLENARFEGLLEQRCFLSIHEAAIDILRPRKELSEADLRIAQKVLDRILSDPYYLDWFGDVLRLDDDDNLILDEGLSLRRERLYDYILEMHKMIDGLVGVVESAIKNVEWRCPLSLRRPIGLERTLFHAIGREGVEFEGQPWAFILAAASGELVSSAVLVIEVFRKKGSEDKGPVKLLIGFTQNCPPSNISTWFNDATIAPDRLSTILGGDVTNTTPNGQLVRLKKAVQIPRDVTRGTSAKTVQNLLRGVLVDRPDHRRIGIICHQIHVPAIKKLEAEYSRRIVKIAYFGGGDDRSSNEWHVACDLIVILGTPRIPPAAVASYLIQVGEIGEACREPNWGAIQWEGKSETGESVLVESSGYLDPAWRRAYQEIVRSALLQAIGRGRGILDTGCEVLLLSNEEAGLRISDAEAETLNASSAKTLSALRELTLQNANIYYLGKCSVKSADLAAKLGCSEQLVRKNLSDLEQRGLVIRLGERSGWRPASQPDDGPGSQADSESDNDHLRPATRAGPRQIVSGRDAQRFAK